MARPTLENPRFGFKTEEDANAFREEIAAAGLRHARPTIDGNICVPIMFFPHARRLPISELTRYLRCDNCGERGHVYLTIVWGHLKLD